MGRDDLSANEADSGFISTSALGSLLVAAQAGDLGAKNELFDQIKNYLWLIANHEIPPELNAKVAPSDLVQDTLIEAHVDFSDFQGSEPGELLSWLKKILLHNAQNARRRYTQTHKRNPSQEQTLETSPDSTVKSIEPAHNDPSPSAILSSTELNQSITAAIQLLPSDYQLVLNLRYHENLPFPDIARRMQKTPDAVHKLWERAINKLQQVMAKLHGPHQP
ncbi:MAG: sigma-70 family RNA polymerase sigma factor [Pirellulales bacterium]|nr:sigma-70 family RNA polymerase sigma factor [Pirellulales bacterium]